jgi:hypothetical protein
VERERRVGRKRRGAGVRARASASSVYMCTRALLACPCLSRHHLIVGVSSHEAIEHRWDCRPDGEGGVQEAGAADVQPSLAFGCNLHLLSSSASRGRARDKSRRVRTFKNLAHIEEADEVLAGRLQFGQVALGHGGPRHCGGSSASTFHSAMRSGSGGKLQKHAPATLGHLRMYERRVCDMH